MCRGGWGTLFSSFMTLTGAGLLVFKLVTEKAETKGVKNKTSPLEIVISIHWRLWHVSLTVQLFLCGYSCCTKACSCDEPVSSWFHLHVVMQQVPEAATHFYHRDVLSSAFPLLGDEHFYFPSPERVRAWVCVRLDCAASGSNVSLNIAAVFNLHLRWKCNCA